MTEAGPRFVARALIGRVLAPHRPVLALVILACCLYLPCVWTRDLWSPDEPRYTEVAREMVARGDWILPHLNGEVYGEKPPVFFWLGILAGSLPGVPFEAGPRFVSVLAALGALLLTFQIGRRSFDAETGWLAALVLATTSMFAVHASLGVIDGTLTLLIVGAIACGLRARETASPVLWLAFYLLAGLAVITKGPVGVAIPAGALLLVALQEDGTRRMWALHPFWGVLVIAGVGALWLVPAIARGGQEYAWTILFKQNVGRAYQSWHHREPLHYFLGVFPAAYVPWIVVLPGALYAAFLARSKHRGARLALTWFVFTFLFFSVISGKKTRYLLPLLPAASLLVAFDLRPLLHPAATGLPSADQKRRMAQLGVCALLVAGSGAALIAGAIGGMGFLIEHASGLAPEQVSDLQRLARPPGSLAVGIPGLALIALGVCSLASLRRDMRVSLACAMTGCLVVVGWAQWVAVPAFNSLKSARPLAEAALAASAGGEIVLYRESHHGVFNFYLGRDAIPVLRGVDRAADYLGQRPGCVVVAAESDLARLKTRLDSLETVRCRRVGSDTVCVGRVKRVAALVSRRNGPAPWSRRPTALALAASAADTAPRDRSRW